MPSLARRILTSSDWTSTPNGNDAKKRFPLWGNHGIVLPTQHFKRKSPFLESAKVLVVMSLILSTFTLYALVENIPNKHDFPLRNFDVPLQVRTAAEPVLKLSDIILPGPLETGSDDEGFDGADYGELYIAPLSEHDTVRNIKYTNEDEFFQQFAPEDDPMRGKAYYHAYDDDAKRNPYHAFHRGEQLAKKYHCRQVAWHRDFFPNCNDFHSIDTPTGTAEQSNVSGVRRLDPTGLWHASALITFLTNTFLQWRLLSRSLSCPSGFGKYACSLKDGPARKAQDERLRVSSC